MLRLKTLLRDLTSCYIFVLAAYKSRSAHRPLTHTEDLSNRFYDLAEMFSMSQEVEMGQEGRCLGCGQVLIRARWRGFDIVAA